MVKENTMRHRDVDDILKQLNESVSQIFSSEYYLKTYLSTYAKFHRYSINNIIWIMMQRPDATQVASFIDWDKKFHRKVKKGSKGIKVLVPIKKKFSIEEEILQEDGSTTTSNKDFEKLYFTTGNVFDISDTIGSELPTLTKILNYNSNFLNELIQKIVQSSIVPITFETRNSSGANGYYIPSNKEIHIRDDIPGLHKLKTIIHEFSHHLQETKYEDITKEYNRNEKEVIAEACSYTVFELLKEELQMEQLSSDDYSFGYIVSWSTKELKELKSTLSIISKISNELFDWIIELINSTN